MKSSPALRQSTAPVETQVNGNCLGVGGIRLNLGGRNKPISGFLTVDLSTEHEADIRADVSDLSQFEDNSISEIYASQILEHFPHVRTQYVLEEWYRVLKKGARITIGVPDFARAVELYQKCGLVDFVVNLLYGDQGYDLAYHYRPFTFGTLAALLNQVGFKNIKKIEKMPYGIVDCSSLIVNLDNKNVSLNVEAWK